MLRQIDIFKEMGLGGFHMHCRAGMLSAGKHMITVNSNISRRNCFGDVHNADEKFSWQGATAWVTTNHLRTYEYRLKREGIITTPLLFKK